MLVLVEFVLGNMPGTNSSQPANRDSQTGLTITSESGLRWVRAIEVVGNQFRNPILTSNLEPQSISDRSEEAVTLG